MSELTQIPLEHLRGLGRVLTGADAPYQAAEWEQLARAATLHGLGPAMYRAVRGKESVPGAVLDRLRSLYAENALRNQLVFRQVGHIARGFEEAQISLLALKGVHVAAVVYPDPALRPMTDVDLLVSRDELARGEALLRAMGYNWSQGTLMEENCAGTHHLAPFYKARAARVELHWTVVSAPHPFHIDLPNLWVRSQTVAIAGQPVRVLSPEDLLLHLSLHLCFSHRCMLPLRSVYDIALLLGPEGAPLDWEYLRHAAKSAGTTRVVQGALALAGHYFGVTPPEARASGFALSEMQNQWFVSRGEVLIAGYGTFRSFPAYAHKDGVVTNHRTGCRGSDGVDSPTDAFTTAP